MIRSFRSQDAERLLRRERPLGIPPELHRIALKKLLMLNSAERLLDLRVPPGNRLEALRGDRAGRFSIRINERYRICFAWFRGDAFEVEIVDYH